MYLKSKSNIDLTDFNFLLGSPELEDPMQADPSCQSRVYLSCDSLYWINDGDCHRYPLDHLPTDVTVQHVIVSEFWIRREVMHAKPDDCVDQGLIILILLIKTKLSKCAPACGRVLLSCYRRLLITTFSNQSRPNRIGVASIKVMGSLHGIANRRQLPALFQIAR